MTGPMLQTPDEAAYQAWLAKRKGPAVPAADPKIPVTHDDAAYQAWKAQRQGQQGPPGPPGPPDQTVPQRSGLYNAINTVDNALTAGLGQKFNAAFNAAGDALRGRDSFGHSYTQNLDAEHAGLNAFRTAHPYGAAGLGAVGAVGQIAAAAPVMASGEIANGLSLGARTLAAARMGGGFGAVGALGNAPNRGGMLDQLATAAKGGAAGAAAGAVAVPATEALAAGAQRVANGFGPVLERVKQTTARAAQDDAASPATMNVPKMPAQIAGAPATPPSPAAPPLDHATVLMLKRLQRAGLTPQEALDRLAQIPGDKPVSLMEVAGDQSHPLRQLGKWVARTPSTGAAQLRAAIADRSEPLTNANRVLDDVGQALGANRTNLVDNAAALKTQQIANAKPHYAAVEHAPPVPITAQVGDGPTLGDLLKRPSIKNAVKYHNDVAAERGEDPIELGKVAADSEGETLYQTMLAQGINPDKARAFVDEHYGPAPSASIALKSLQKLKFKLDDMLGFAKTRGQLPDGTPATNAKLGAINETRVALLDIMKAHSPDLAAGNASWAGDAAVKDAGEQGAAFLSRPIDELQRAYPAMTPGEQAQHNVAAVSGPIRNRVFNTSAVDRAKIFSNPDIQERLQAVAPADALSALRKRLGVEHQIALTNQQVPNGSDTAENLMNDADASGTTLKSLFTGLAMGRPRRALSSVSRAVVSPLVDSWIHGINEGTANALAPKLTAGMQSRQDVQTLLEELATALDRAQRTRGSLPYAGAATGAVIGGASLRRP